MKKIIMVLGILLLSVVLVLANGSHHTEIGEGKELVESGANCDKLNDEQLEAIGEYLMEQMHPGESHELMHKMMGLEEGSKAEEQFHVNMAKMMYCGQGGMMDSEGMMGMTPMMMNMMGGQNVQGGMMQQMMGNWGYGYGYWNFVNILYVILLVGLIVLVYLWIVRLLRDTKNKRSKK